MTAKIYYMQIVFQGRVCTSERWLAFDFCHRSVCECDCTTGVDSPALAVDIGDEWMAVTVTGNIRP